MDRTVLGNSSFETALCTLLPELRRKARFLTGNSVAADDLVQDTVERALRFRDTFREGSSLRAWALRILSNCFVSQKRRTQIERRVLERNAHDPNGFVSCEPLVQKPGLSPPVTRALTRLPQRLRKAVTLVDLQDSSYRDAASAMDVPVGTVMSRLHRGRARLAGELAEPKMQSALASPLSA